MIKKINSICIVGQGLKGGGIERAFSSLANYYNEIGFNVSVVLLFDTDHFFVLNSNIKIYCPKIKREKYNKHFYAFKIFNYLRSSIRNIQSDVVLSFNEWYNPFVLVATRGLNIPVFVTDRMSPDLKLNFIHSLARKILYNKAAGVIAQTNYAAEKINVTCRPKQIIVIPNPVNVIDVPKRNKKRSIVTLGRLSAEKGHKYLIEAFGKIRQNDWELDIIGDGPDKEMLQKLSERVCDGKVVNFHGHLREFTDIMGEAQIFVLPSLSEGFPNALIEAMSVPLACISSNCVAGPSDIIIDKVNGLLVNVADSQDLADKIQMLIDDINLRESISKNAYEIRKTLDFNEIANKYLNFMNNIINS